MYIRARKISNRRLKQPDCEEKEKHKIMRMSAYYVSMNYTISLLSPFFVMNCDRTRCDNVLEISKLPCKCGCAGNTDGKNCPTVLTQSSIDFVTESPLPIGGLLFAGAKARRAIA